MLDIEIPGGNMYAWDDNTGFVIPSSPIMKTVINEFFGRENLSKEDIIKKFKDDHDEGQIAFCYDWIKKWEKIRSKNYNCSINQDTSSSSISNYLLKDGLSQLILGVTEECNFRCNYCEYSDNYDNIRCHSELSMSPTIAKRGIDYYLHLFEEGRRYNPIRKPAMYPPIQI
jgi:uncharacterized protein